MAGKKTKEFMAAIDKLCVEYRQMLNKSYGYEEKWRKTSSAIQKLPTENRTPTEEQAWKILEKREEEGWEAIDLVGGGLKKKLKQIDDKMKALAVHLKTFVLPTPVGKKYLKRWRGTLAEWQKNWHT